MMLFLKIIFICLLIPMAWGEEKSNVEKEGEILDFKSIKEILKNDKLEKEASQSAGKIKIERKKRVDKGKNKYNIPFEDEFWPFFSEYWLVKNAPVLKWDFKKPDYGIEEAFETLLEKLGHYEKKFKIVLVNTTSLYHFPLPSSQSEYIFLLSVPFIQYLDLSKIEISLLLFEDYIREKMGFFRKKVSRKKVEELYGSNFEGNALPVSEFNQMLKDYDDFILNKGFSFQQQFEVTKEMIRVLKSEMTLWNIYVNLLKKLDGIVKTENNFKDYGKIFPSPEIQLNWLKVETK